MRYHLSDIIRQYLPAYLKHYSLTGREMAVCRHILSCRTHVLGSQQWECNQCHYQHIHPCSCRDRHCPRCQGKQTQQWVTEQQQQVIHGRYFHLVFTLPHELNVITQYASKALYTSLFEAVWQTLDKFARNRGKIKGQLGCTMVLHTWGQTLTQHIHLHCLIPGGMLSNTDKYRQVKSDYLFPVKALSTVFRAKMMQSLRKRIENLPDDEKLWTTPWCVYAKRCLCKADTVIEYLGRYTRKGMFSESRIKHIDDTHVTFSYRDYRQPSMLKKMSLSGVEFIRRYLQHVLPKGMMRVRHYGYLANRCRRKKLVLIHSQTKPVDTTEQGSEKVNEYQWPCPLCKNGILIFQSIQKSVKEMDLNALLYNPSG